MAVTDLWTKRDGTPSKRSGVGLRYRVKVVGYPAKSFRYKRAAEDYERKLLSSTEIKTTTDVTVGDLLPTWLDGKKHLSAGGRSVVVAGAGRVRERWGSELVTQVYDHDVQAWIVGITVKGKPASRDTMAKTLSALRGAMNIAVTLGLVDANPCAGIKLPRPERRDARFLTAAELRTLVSKTPEYGQAMIWLLGTTGIRVGECCRLNVEDIDVKRARLRVRRSKNGTARDVPIPASVLARLNVDGRAGDEPLFTSKWGRRPEPKNFNRKVFSPAAAAVGLKGMHVHDLRHTAASLMIASGADVKKVQNALGHKRAAMTLDLYGHLFDTGLDDVSARMEQMIS